MWLILQMRYMPKLKQSCCDWSDQVRSVTKTKKDNDVTEWKGEVNVKNYIELSCPIKSSVVYDENQIEH